VVNVGTKERPSYLPAEVCVVIPGQAYNRQLDPQQTEQMMNFASRRPWANAKSIVERGFDTVGLSSSGNPVLVGITSSLLIYMLTLPRVTLELQCIRN
jgi:hypothetical protein